MSQLMDQHLSKLLIVSHRLSIEYNQTSVSISSPMFCIIIDCNTTQTHKRIISLILQCIYYINNHHIISITLLHRIRTIQCHNITDSLVFTTHLCNPCFIIISYRMNTIKQFLYPYLDGS